MIQIQEILELNVAERILLIEKIWDSIEPDSISLSDVHEQELNKRMERYQKGETSFVSWHDIKNELNALR